MEELYPKSRRSGKRKDAGLGVAAARPAGRSVRPHPVQDRLPDERLGVAREEQVGVAEVGEPLVGRGLVDDMDGHVPAAQERRRVNAELAEAAAGPDVEDGDPDLREV